MSRRSASEMAEPPLTNVETRYRAAIEKRRKDLVAEGANFVRHKVAFTGPAEFLAMCRRWYKFGFEDACK